MNANNLYGRQREASILHDIFVSCTPTTLISDDDPNHCSLVLLQGAAGVGKRTLVEQTLRPLVENLSGGGRFISCRFAPLRTPSDNNAAVLPSPTENKLLGAVTEVLQSIDNEIKSTLIEDNILPDHVSVGSDFDVWTDLLPPKLGQRHALLRNDDAGSTTSGTTATHGPTHAANQSLLFNDTLTLVRCLQALSACNPIVLFLDQAQNADSETLDAISKLMMIQDDETKPRHHSKGLLIVLSYRNDSVLPDPLTTFLTSLVRDHSPTNRTATPSSSSTAQRGNRIRRIDLTNLLWDDVYLWIRDWLGPTSHNGTEELVDETTDVVYDVTSGNPFFTKLFLCYFESLDHLRSRDGFESPRNALPHSVCDLYRQIVNHQDSVVQRIIETAAALCEVGEETVTRDVLEMVLEQPCTSELAVTQDRGLLELVETDRWRFPSPETQATAYAMIPEARRKFIHLRIGRRIWKNSSLGLDDERTEDAEMLYTVTRQLQQGVELVTAEDERRTLALICWRAGKKATESSAFVCAAAHFDFGIQVLGDDVWSSNLYDISLRLHNFAAEAYYCTGDFIAMDRMLQNVFSHARSLEDKLQAYTTKVYAHGARNQFKEALDTSNDLLRQLGEPIPSNPSKRTVLIEYIKTRWLLRGHTDRYFLSLPETTNASDVTALMVLCFAFTSSYMSNRNLGAVILFRMLRRSIQHGMCGPSVVAFSGYAMIQSLLIGNIEEGYRYGQIALSLVEQYNARPWLPRVYFMVYGMINRWIIPLHECIGPLKVAQHTSLKTGDFESCLIASSIYFFTSFNAGVILTSLEEESRSVSTMMESYGQTLGLLFVLPLLNFFSDFSGTTPFRLQSSGEVMDYSGVLTWAEKAGNKYAIFHCYVYPAIFACFAGDYHASLRFADQAHMSSQTPYFCLFFFEGLAALAAARDAGFVSRRRLLSLGQKCIRSLKRWGRRCSANSHSKIALLEAELASIRGKSMKAIHLFNMSIHAAQQGGLIHEEGLAYERLGQYHRYLGHQEFAMPFLQSARNCYAKWGARKLVRRMDELTQDDTIIDHTELKV